MQLIYDQVGGCCVVYGDTKDWVNERKGCLNAAAEGDVTVSAK